MKTAIRIHPSPFRRVALAVMIAAAIAPAAHAVSDAHPIASTVMFGTTGIASMDHYANGHAKATLESLRPIDRIPPDAQRSMIPVELQENHRRHLGVSVPEGSAVGTSNAPLISIEDARRTVSFGDDADGPYVMAGYFLPTETEPDRRPWMRAVFAGGGPIDVEFDLRSATRAAQGLALREVAAIDAKHIYFLAAADDGRTRLLMADYTFTRLPDRVSP
jgi:hypothetical protein